MICNLCGVNESTIHLTEIVNDQMIEIHLCETCAQEKGTEFKTHFNVNELLAGLTDVSKWSETYERSIANCANCKLSYEEFGKKGRLGCPHCYASFEKALVPLIRRVQRSTLHIGKRPGKNPVSSPEFGDLKLLQQRLRKCIHDEAFEEAASLRDKIKKLEEKMDGPKPKSQSAKRNAKNEER